MTLHMGFKAQGRFIIACALLPLVRRIPGAISGFGGLGIEPEMAHPIREASKIPLLRML